MATINLTVNIPDNRVQDVLDALDSMHPRTELDENGNPLPHTAATAKNWMERESITSLRRVYRRYRVRIAKEQGLGLE